MPFLFPPLDHVAEESTSTKCTKEGVPTEHVFKVVTPFNPEAENPLEALKLSKRLLICTSCGNMRLID